MVQFGPTVFTIQGVELKKIKGVETFDFEFIPYTKAQS